MCEDEQASEHGTATGHEGNWLEVTAEQYAALKRIW